MPTRTPGADPEGVSSYTHGFCSDSASLNHPVTLPDASHAPAFNVPYDSVPNTDLDNTDFANTPAVPNQSDGARIGSGQENINVGLRSQLEGTGFLDHVNPRVIPPAPGNVSAVILSPTILRGPFTEPASTSTPLGFVEAVDDDDIAAEAILTSAPPVRQQPSRSRFFPHPLPVFDSDDHSPVPAPIDPARNRRTFTIPIPTFDIAPTVELPPSRDSSLVCADLDEQLDTGMGDVLSRINDGSLAPQSPSLARSNIFHLLNLDDIDRVSPRNVHHPRPTKWYPPSWVRAGVVIVTICSTPAASDPRISSSCVSTNSGPTNEAPSLAMSTPSWRYTEASFSSSSNIYAASNAGVQQYVVPNLSEPPNPLQYPPEEPSVEGAPVTNCFAETASSPYFQFTFNHARTGTLPPHPPGFVAQPGQTSWLDIISVAGTSLPINDGPSQSHGTDLEYPEHHRAPLGLENSSFEFESYTGSSVSDTEIIGNRREESPFGPAIHSQSHQSAPSSSSANEPNRPVRIRPLSNDFATYRTQARTFLSESPFTEPDDFFDESTPSTPSPPSSDPQAQQPSASNLNAYSLPPILTAHFVTGTENALPPINLPEEPSQTVLPSILELSLGEATETEGGRGANLEAEGSGLPGASNVEEGSGDSLGTPKGTEESGKVVDANLDKLSGAALESDISETSDEDESLELDLSGSEVSEDGNEGDDEDQINYEDEDSEYFSFSEDEIVDILSPNYALPLDFQHPVLEPFGSESCPVVLDRFSESEGSAYSDDGHVHYTTDDAV